MLPFQIMFLLLLFIVSQVSNTSFADDGTAAQYSPPYLTTAGDGIWDNGASCGRQYLVRCISAGTCIPDRTIQIKIVDRAITSQSRPSVDGTTIVSSSTAFSTIADSSASSINIEFQQSAKVHRRLLSWVGPGERRHAPSDSIPNAGMTPSASLRAVCSATQFPDSCFSSVASLEASENITDPEIFFKLSLQVAIKEVAKLIEYPTKLISQTNDKQVQEALKVCGTVFDDALEGLNDSLSSMQVKEGEKLLSPSKIDDIKTWLSSSITYQQTCLDSLVELNLNATNSMVFSEIEAAMKNSTEFVSNSLAICAKILGLLSQYKIPLHRKLLGFEQVSDIPSWVGPEERRLLRQTKTKPDAVVAADGSGDYTTIQAAVDQVPKKSDKRFVIYVKEGTYKENVVLDKSKWNVMMSGDGKTLTVVSGSLNFVDGTPTFATATLAVAGRGFIAKDMKFINTAGPEKHQAVAFRSGSDHSIFYQCAFDAFQDTLYAHSNRQLYHYCDITGTIDFIFGNAAVVFQNCNIMPRQPLPNQFNTITAQGKNDPNQNTGISIQRCTFSVFGTNLTAPTFLGRPWKDYSTTVIMKSTIGSFLHPLGWKEWIGNVVPPSTIFYAEYQNTGPGSVVTGRVKWPGYRPTLKVDEAAKFTVRTFIQGLD